jgi:hypothetical protein
MLSGGDVRADDQSYDHGRSQQRYDHRMRELVQRTWDLTIATDLGVPRSTARGWLRTVPTVVVSLEMANLTELELRQEVLNSEDASRSSRRCSDSYWSCCTSPASRCQASDCPMVPTSGGFCVQSIRPPHVSRCGPSCGSYASPSRFHAWRRRHTVCSLDDQSSCPHTSPHRLAPPEIRVIENMVTSPEYRHVPTGTLAVLAQRLAAAINGSCLTSPGSVLHVRI